MTTAEPFYDVDRNRMRRQCPSCGVVKDECSFFRDKVPLPSCLTCARVTRDKQARAVVCRWCEAEIGKPCKRKNGGHVDRVIGVVHRVRMRDWMRSINRKEKPK